MKPSVYYIHGFASCRESDTGQFLREHCAFGNVVCLVYKSEWSFEENLNALLAQLNTEDCARIFVGTSLGGFYVFHLAFQKPEISGAVLVNPAVSPEKALEHALGKNTYFHNGESFELSVSVLNSYGRNPLCFPSAFPIHLVLGRRDEVLPPEQTEAFFKNRVTSLRYVDEPHRIGNKQIYLREALALLKHMGLC